LHNGGESTFGEAGPKDLELSKWMHCRRHGMYMPSIEMDGVALFHGGLGVHRARAAAAGCLPMGWF
jgi:hypothetical protein